MINKIYAKHLYSVFFNRFIIVTLVFASLIFVLNILEELKFFSNHEDIGIGYPVFLTMLNLPSILFEIFPFIILITTQFFFIRFQNNNEILIFRNNGVNNLKIIGHICLIVFIIGMGIVILFHFFSSAMKHTYLEFKNKYTQDNKYLAVINENGLWIKDILDERAMIIHAEKIDKNLLKNIVITTFDLEYRNQTNIIAKEAVITEKIWEIKNLVLINDNGLKENMDEFNFKTNFDYIKINSLFSNLESLNLIELYKQKKDFESVGLNSKDIDIYINKLISLPVSLIIFALFTSILMFNIKIKTSKTFILILGILISVIFYYIFYFFGLLGSNDKLPTILATWFPNLILFLSCGIGMININEK